jgi:hypothetical protein
METMTNRGSDMNTSECIEARMWDSEKRNSPYSTVADIEDEFCDCCGDAHDCGDCEAAGF